MTFSDRIGAVFDEADSVQIRQEREEYNHARVRGFDILYIPRYKRELDSEGLNYDFNETAHGPEFEVWENRKI